MIIHFIGTNRTLGLIYVFSWRQQAEFGDLVDVFNFISKRNAPFFNFKSIRVSLYTWH